MVDDHMLNTKSVIDRNIKGNQICGLQLPSEPHWSTRLLPLTGRWQYKGIM